jgi:IstB-like ATP binding protein
LVLGSDIPDPPPDRDWLDPDSATPLHYQGHLLRHQTKSSECLTPTSNKHVFTKIEKRGIGVLFQVVAARYDVGSIVISTNRPFREWGKLFDADNTLATALIDRLMHHGEGIVIQADGFRIKDKDPDSTNE